MKGDQCVCFTINRNKLQSFRQAIYHKTVDPEGMMHEKCLCSEWNFIPLGRVKLYGKPRKSD